MSNEALQQVHYGRGAKERGHTNVECNSWMGHMEEEEPDEDTGGDAGAGDADWVHPRAARDGVALFARRRSRHNRVPIACALTSPPMSPASLSASH